MGNLLGEFIGTTVLIAFGCGTNANLSLNKSYAKGAGWIVTVWGWGLAVLLGVYTANALGAPQADLNPSVTLAKTFAGVYTFGQCLATMLAELCGGVFGAVLVWLAFLPHWKATKDPGTKLGVFATGPAINSPVCNFITEMIATFFLMFVIWMIFAPGNGQLPPGFGPYAVGLLIVALGCSFGGATGYSLNMARDLGPRIAHAMLPIPGKGDSNWGYAWIPSIAPLFGGTLAYIVAHILGIV